MGSLAEGIDRTRRPLAVWWREHHCKQQRFEITRGKRRLLAARSKREGRNDKRKAVSRPAPTDHPDRPIEVGRRRTGPEKEGDKQKTCPLLQSRERGREREVHFTCLGCGFSNLAYDGLPLHTNYNTRNRRSSHMNFAALFSLSLQHSRPSSLRAFRMKVFSSEFEQCGERESGAGGRRDKLIFEHFQTPLSPPSSPAALHRVCLPGSGQVLTPAPYPTACFGHPVAVVGGGDGAD